MENILYRFKEVSVEQFATLTNELSAESRIDFDTELSFRYLANDRVLVSRCEVLLSQDKDLKMKAIFDCLFEIKEESVFGITKEDGSIVFPRNLLIQLASLNYGTLRGIVLERTKGTAFSSIILPPLIVGNIIETDLIIRKEGE